MKRTKEHDLANCMTALASVGHMKEKVSVENMKEWVSVDYMMALALA